MTLLSIEFIGLAIALIVWVRFVPDPLRLAGFVVGSGVYAASFLTPTGYITTGGLIAAGFALAKVVRARPALTGPAVGALVLAFVYFRGYDVVLAVIGATSWDAALASAGLSYLLFKVIHVVVDAAGGGLPGLSLGRYVAYCLNFTTFLLGPIQRYQSFVDQWDGIHDPLAPDLVSHLDAVNRVMRGFVKKWVLAVYVSRLALLPGESVEGMGPLDIILGSWGFYLYLYCDFSGYCDIVIGIGRLMGIAPPENFNLPFFSPNIAQYWLRVHRSLTEWLTDYVFQPLYTTLLRRPEMRAHRLASRNIAIAGTMIVAGLWHGTTLSFLLFGLVHAGYQVIYRTSEHLLTSSLGAARLRELRATRPWVLASTGLTFVATASAYAFFVLTPAQLTSLATAWWGL